MPQGRHAHAATAMGGKIYVTGGLPEIDDGDNDYREEEDGDNDEDTQVTSDFMYDPQADAWTQLASMGIARGGHASAAVGGKLYVFGGAAAGEHLSTAEVTTLLWIAGRKCRA